MATSLNTRKTATRLPWKCGTFFLLLSPCYMQDIYTHNKAPSFEIFHEQIFLLSLDMNYFCRFVVHGAEIYVYSKHYRLRGRLKPSHFNFFSKFSWQTWSVKLFALFFAPCSFGLCSTFRPFMWVWVTIKFIWRKRSGFSAIKTFLNCSRS